MRTPEADSEWLTRKRRIDPVLDSLGWRKAPSNRSCVNPFSHESSRESVPAPPHNAARASSTLPTTPSTAGYHRIDEYETDNGPADYALCAADRVLGIVEATMAELGELCEVRSGGTPKREVDAYWNGSIPWTTTSLIDFNVIHRAEEFITEAGLDSSSAWIVPKGTVVMAMFGQGFTRGRVAVLGIDAAMNQACAAFTIRDGRITSDYLYHALEAEYDKLRDLSDARGGNQSNLSGAVLKQYAIPLPPLETQRSIVSEIEAERRLVEANRELIRRMETKIAAALIRIWGEPADAPQSVTSGNGEPIAHAT